MMANKDVKISIIRMISTIMVVILHIFQQLESDFEHLHIITDWFNLGLVMFFCISGYLYSNRQIEEPFKWIKHRYSEIALPATVVSVLTVIVFIFVGDLSTEKVFAAIASGLGLEAFLKDSWMFIQLWFLTYIMIFYLSVPVIQKINCKCKSNIKFWIFFILFMLLGQVVFFALEVITKVELISWGVLLRAYIPYFLFRRYDINSSETTKTMVYLSVLSVFAIIITVFARYIYSFGAISELIFIYTQTLAGCVLFFWLYRLFGKVNNYGTIVKISDCYSYNIYLTHCLFIGYNTSVLKICTNKLFGIVLALVMTAISSIFVRYVIIGLKNIKSKIITSNS